MTIKSMRYFWWFVVACAAVDIAAGMVYSVFPQWRYQITQEDRFVENAEAATYLFAFVLGMVVLRDRTLPKLSRGERVPVYLASGLGLLYFFEEISYGERILQIEPPYIAGTKFDSFHDIFFITYTAIKPYLHPWVLPVVGVVVVVVIFACRKLLFRFVSRVLSSEPYLLIAAMFSQLALSQFGDLEIIQWEHENFFEELFELNAAMALVFSIMSAIGRPAPEIPPDG